MMPSIYLDYGVDEHDCAAHEFEICERGMRFTSRWQFLIGTQLSVSFSRRNPDGTMQRFTTEGIIVDCEPVTCRCHRTTLLFLELPEALRRDVRGAGHRPEMGLKGDSEGHTKPASAFPRTRFR